MPWGDHGNTPPLVRGGGGEGSSLRHQLEMGDHPLHTIYFLYGGKSLDIWGRELRRVGHKC